MKGLGWYLGYMFPMPVLGGWGQAASCTLVSKFCANERPCLRKKKTHKNNDDRWIAPKIVIQIQTYILIFQAV